MSPLSFHLTLIRTLVGLKMRAGPVAWTLLRDNLSEIESATDLILYRAADLVELDEPEPMLADCFSREGAMSKRVGQIAMGKVALDSKSTLCCSCDHVQTSGFFGGV